MYGIVAVDAGVVDEMARVRSESLVRIAALLHVGVVPVVIRKELYMRM